MVAPEWKRAGASATTAAAVGANDAETSATTTGKARAAPESGGPAKKPRKANTVTTSTPERRRTKTSTHQAPGKRCAVQEQFTVGPAIVCPASRTAVSAAAAPATIQEDASAETDIGGREEKTIKRYNALNKRLLAWLQERHAALVHNNSVVLPLPACVATSYLDFISIKCDKRGTPLEPRQTTSASHVGNASSALVYLHKDAKVEMPPELCAALKAFTKKYTSRTNREEGTVVTPEEQGSLLNGVQQSAQATTKTHDHTTARCPLTMAAESGSDPDLATSEPSVPTFSWDGRSHPVPADFVLPPCTVHRLWCMWYEGIPASGIGPLRKLRSFDLTKLSDRSKLSKARKVIETVVLAAGHSHETSVASMAPKARASVFKLGFRRTATKLKRRLVSRFEWGARRVNEMRYITFYDLVLKSKSAP
ncbi:hypothetical protein SPRG_11066 [Saprolegnia parasitica CBS 223.65]|uniref:Uncharacterized protein n=1 Tax=Saprolegnia parasitica (strain CBS 223.65) TaxID=695850 RepID=A0A067BYM2_SAPPC|nr:hypothetical protein SPRG_11066 [Saprolegnia parasitica CBS 223.65]KDO23619.1 hypothetical protein SPRG_11066 [Saprolegnia parasitica CBS 223.65]|eukprot:XP_012205603.1 hypothetical protein SPRG_11066 [Saprolegnia parasitica CBS 223.65]